MNNLNKTNQHQFQEMLVLPTSNGLAIIRLEDIIKIEAVSNYSKLFLANGKWLVVAKVLHWFEERLSANGFIRVHRSHLINQSHIRLYWSNGIVLQNGETVAVAKRKRTAFLKQLKQAAALQRA